MAKCKALTGSAVKGLNNFLVIVGLGGDMRCTETLIIIIIIIIREQESAQKRRRRRGH